MPLKPWVEQPKFPPRFERGQLALHAPAGFIVWFGPHAVYMSHSIRFKN